MNQKDQLNTKYQITIFCPLEKGYTPQAIKQIMESINPQYYCFAYELGVKSGLQHVHIFVVFRKPISHVVLERAFATKIHVESCRGSCKANIDYISKAGRWQNDPKAKSSIPGSFVEHGTLSEAGVNTRSDQNDQPGS